MNLIQFPNLLPALPAPKLQTNKSSLLLDSSSRLSAVDISDMTCSKESLIHYSPSLPQIKTPCFGISVDLPPTPQLLRPNTWESPSSFYFLVCIQFLSKACRLHLQYLLHVCLFLPQACPQVSATTLSHWEACPAPTPGPSPLPLHPPQAAASTCMEGRGEVAVQWQLGGDRAGAERHSPLPEVSIEQPVGESLAANPDPLQNAIAAQLM